MNRAKHIPWLLLVIGGCFLFLTAWALFSAAWRTSGVTDRDYYSHGLRYNQTQLERKAAASLGWTAATELQDDWLLVRLRDRHRQPVTGAAGRLSLLGANGKHDLTSELQEVSPGLYRGKLPDHLQGEQPARIVFEREGVRLNKRLLLSLR